MKRILACLLIFCLLLPFAGCAKPQFQTPGSFYYRRTEITYGSIDGVIAPEIRELARIDGDIDAILAEYLKGPQSFGLESPFPRDTKVEQWSLDNGTLVLTMSQSFAAISGVELTIACACMTRTMLGLLDITQVQFQVPEGLLGGERLLTYSDGLLSLSDDSLDQAWAEFTVYYTDRQQRYLIAQEVSVNLATESDVIAHLFSVMKSPPENSGLLSAIPPGSDLIDYVIDDEVCTIILSGEFEYNGWRKAEAQRLSLLSVVNMLTQLEEITQVEFQIDGNLLVQYRLISITNSLEFDSSAVGPVRTGMNEFDATLYLCNSAEPYLTPVPTRLRQSSGMTEAELVLNAMLEYDACNGFYSPIPQSTKIHSVSVENGLCHVDLSQDFLTGNPDLLRSVRSIAASICALDGISAVQITIDGGIPGDVPEELFRPLSPKTDWFV